MELSGICSVWQRYSCEAAPCVSLWTALEFQFSALSWAVDLGHSLTESRKSSLKSVALQATNLSSSDTSSSRGVFSSDTQSNAIIAFQAIFSAPPIVWKCFVGVQRIVGIVGVKKEVATISMRSGRHLRTFDTTCGLRSESFDWSRHLR